MSFTRYDVQRPQLARGSKRRLRNLNQYARCQYYFIGNFPPLLFRPKVVLKPTLEILEVSQQQKVLIPIRRGNPQCVPSERSVCNKQAKLKRPTLPSKEPVDCLTARL